MDVCTSLMLFPIMSFIRQISNNFLQSSRDQKVFFTIVRLVALQRILICVLVGCLFVLRFTCRLAYKGDFFFPSPLLETNGMIVSLFLLFIIDQIKFCYSDFLVFLNIMVIFDNKTSDASGCKDFFVCLLFLPYVYPF